MGPTLLLEQLLDGALELVAERRAGALAAEAVAPVTKDEPLGLDGGGEVEGRAVAGVLSAWEALATEREREGCLRPSPSRPRRRGEERAERERERGRAGTYVERRMEEVDLVPDGHADADDDEQAHRGEREEDWVGEA